jgi:ribosomal protein S18 acetylase RimI-like enzyme
MSGAFSLVPLAAADDRSGFSCGIEPLDRYFREFVTQDIKRRVASCYVAKSLDDGSIAGFYTLSASGIPLTGLPADLTKKLPRYPLVPVARLGRLAIDLRFRRQRLGSALLWDAIMRAGRSDVTVFALAVDAKDETAANFYRHFGFRELSSLPNQFLWVIGK